MGSLGLLCAVDHQCPYSMRIASGLSAPARGMARGALPAGTARLASHCGWHCASSRRKLAVRDFCHSHHSAMLVRRLPVVCTSGSAGHCSSRCVAGTTVAALRLQPEHAVQWHRAPAAPLRARLLPSRPHRAFSGSPLTTASPPSGAAAAVLPCICDVMIVPAGVGPSFSKHVAAAVSGFKRNAALKVWQHGWQCRNADSLDHACNLRILSSFLFCSVVGLPTL